MADDSLVPETIPLKKIRGTVSDQKPLATALSVGATEVSAEGVPQSRPLLAGIARLPAVSRGLKGVPPRPIRGADARPIGLSEALGHLVGRGQRLGPRRRGRHHRSRKADEGEQQEHPADGQSVGLSEFRSRGLQKHGAETCWAKKNYLAVSVELISSHCSAMVYTG